MTIADIRPKEDIPNLLSHVAKRDSGLQRAEVWRHRKKDGTIIDVEIVCHDPDFTEGQWNACRRVQHYGGEG